MTILIKLFKLHLRIIYFFMKLVIKTKDKKLLLMSRQSDEASIDFKLVCEDMQKRYPDWEVVVLTKLIKKTPKELILYYFHIYKQMYHLASSKVCLIDTYIIPVSILKHKDDLVIIQLCHGIGNLKKFAYQTLDNESGKGRELSLLMDMHKNYDYLVSTSLETSKFYAEAFNMPVSKMLNFGPPKIDYLLTIPKKKSSVLKKYPHLKDKPVILYVSTFRTYEDNYLEKFINYANTDKYNIIIHIHPVAYTHHPDIDKNISSKFYRCKDIPTIELLSVADYVVTDYSSFLFESVILDIPTLLFVPDYEKYTEKNGLNIDLFKELPHSVFKDSKKLFKCIDNNNYHKEELEKFKNKYIENTSGNSTKLLDDFMVNVKK